MIWYDSVTRRGRLAWQNALNAENRCFFDVCDGIFLNYTWTPEGHLDPTAEEAAGEKEGSAEEDPSPRKKARGSDGSALKESRDRTADVFVGVDVFGRNCFGGGGWNTRAAVDEAVARNLSVAVFAQGDSDGELKSTAWCGLTRANSTTVSDNLLNPLFPSFLPLSSPAV